MNIFDLDLSNVQTNTGSDERLETVGTYTAVVKAVSSKSVNNKAVMSVCFKIASGAEKDKTIWEDFFITEAAAWRVKDFFKNSSNPALASSGNGFSDEDVKGLEVGITVDEGTPYTTKAGNVVTPMTITSFFPSVTSSDDGAVSKSSTNSPWE